MIGENAYCNDRNPLMQEKVIERNTKVWVSALEKCPVCAQPPEAACGSGMGLGRGSGPAQFQSSGLHSLHAFSASSFTKKVPRIFL